MWSTVSSIWQPPPIAKRLGRGDPELLDAPGSLEPAVDLVDEAEVADQEEQVGDLAVVEVREVQPGAEDRAARRSAGARRRRRAARRSRPGGRAAADRSALSQRADRRVVLGVEVARVAQLDDADVARPATAAVPRSDLRRSRGTSSGRSSASCVGRSITSIRWRAGVRRWRARGRGAGPARSRGPPCSPAGARARRASPPGLAPGPGRARPRRRPARRRACGG